MPAMQQNMKRHHCCCLQVPKLCLCENVRLITLRGQLSDEDASSVGRWEAAGIASMLEKLPRLAAVGVNLPNKINLQVSNQPSPLLSCFENANSTYQILRNGSDTLASRGDISMLHSAGPWGTTWDKAYATFPEGHCYPREQDHMGFEHNPAW